ncbi:hypothetical protein K435DRAFT_832946, partial [Dendrothele bispora CBS 962.96]
MSGPHFYSFPLTSSSGSTLLQTTRQDLFIPLAMSAQSGPIRRDMSYRKPVPAYIPSPPSSPSRLPQINTMICHSESTLPPLPDNWKDNVRQANELPGIMLSAPDDTSNDPNSSKFSDKASISQSSTERPKRGLPQIYRPPTPPLISDKKRKTPEESREYLTVPPSPISVRDSYYPPIAGISARSSVQGSLLTLTPQPSNRTDKTMVSSTHSAPEFRLSAWQSTETNQIDRWHDLPVLAMHIVKPLSKLAQTRLLEGAGLGGGGRLSEPCLMVVCTARIKDILRFSQDENP